MLSRYIFAVKEAVTCRNALKMLPMEKSILTVDWEALKHSGVEVIVLDFDGVLAADGEPRVRDEVFPVLNKIQQVFGGRVYILTNKPMEVRQTFFTLNFPWMHFLIAKKKPYPDGLLEIVAREQVEPQAVLLIDDRLLTGGLATVLAKTRCLIIEKPYVNLSLRNIEEVFIFILRGLERLVFYNML